MEDTMDDELTETPTALTDNITPEMASNKVTDDSGSLVHKSSVARMMNKATPLTTPLANTNPLTNTKSQDRVKRAQSIGRFSSRNSSDSTTIDRSFNFSFGLDLPEDADVVKCGDYASVLVNAKSSTGSKLRTFMVIVRLVSFGLQTNVQLERTWDAADTKCLARVEHVHVTNSVDGNGNQAVTIEDKAGVHLSNIPLTKLELISSHTFILSLMIIQHVLQL